jgi:hypothetical protein
MSDETDDKQERPANEGLAEDVRGRGNDGERAARATPPIAADAEPGQTSHQAPEDDVGVPADEQLAHEEAKAQAEARERNG